MASRFQFISLTLKSCPTSWPHSRHSHLISPENETFSQHWQEQSQIHCTIKHDWCRAWNFLCYFRICATDVLQITEITRKIPSTTGGAQRFIKMLYKRYPHSFSILGFISNEHQWSFSTKRSCSQMRGLWPWSYCRTYSNWMWRLADFRENAHSDHYASHQRTNRHSHEVQHTFVLRVDLQIDFSNATTT